MKKITKNDFNNIASDWKRLNEEYDSCIQNFLDNQHIDTEQINHLEKMQSVLFNLEKECFSIMKGEIVIGD